MNMFGKSAPKKEAETRKRDVYNHRAHRETYGLNIKQLKEWSRVRLDQELTTEAAKQQIAVSRVRTFLDAIATVIRIQSWWRSRKLRRIFFAIIAERKERRRLYFRHLKIYWRSERMHSYQLFGKFFLAWREEMRDQKRLQTLIHTFFSLCIQRMRLSPQAVMAYFNPGEWSVNISSTDKMKIRRLLLQRLFNGWRGQSRDLKIVRYKASQILARMMRRTKGPMWVKESTLVCFHMWHRYIRVKRAYRRSEPDPRYTNPFLPQWSKLYKEITVNRIKRKRSQEAGILLTTKRAFRMWIHLMNVDRSKPVTPLAVAISHYNTVLSNKMLLSWYDYVRDRGRNMRFRNKIFLVWKTWAPKHNKLRAKNDEAINWLRLSRQRKSFNAMISICLKVIGMRTEKIKEMRRNFCDRKLVIAAYGLMNMDEHVIMVDCWRKLAYYGRCKRNWKTLNWQYLFAWNQHKSKVLFSAWRDYIREKRAKRQQNMDCDDRSLGSAESILQMHEDTAEISHVVDENGERYHRDMYAGFINDSTELFVKARASQLSTELTSEQFHFFCSLLSQSHKRLPQLEKFDFDDLALYPHGQDNSSSSFFNGDRIPASLLHHFSDLSVETATTMATSPHEIFTIDPVEKNKRRMFYQQIWNSDRQLRLQKALDEANLPSTLDQLSEGAVYDAQSLNQLSMHVGDQFLPVFCLFMMGSVAFLAERVVKGDKNKIINSCHHPIAAFFAASQISRWELQFLTTREFSALTQDPLMLDSTGGRFRAVYFWRNVVLQLLDAKAELAAQTCVTLSENRTVEQEVAEVMKRNKIEKMIHLRHSISQSLGQNPPWTVNDRINQIIPPLVKYTTIKQTIDLLSLVDGREDALRHNKNIYHILREYTFLTGKLANEAKAIRSPLVERDKILSVNGFLKQARQQFLQLRKERMSKADREEEEEKREREEAKAKKLKDKEYAKIKKFRNKKKAKRKKRTKKSKKKRGSRNNTDAEDSDSVDSDASSISSNYFSYDERDTEESSQGLLRDMFSNLNMTEEKEIALEKTFQHRVAYCGNNIFAETWQPAYWKQDIEVRKRHRQRLIMELRCCLRRLFDIVQSDNSIGQVNYEQIKSEYGGISNFIIDKTLAVYNQGLPQVWGPLPKDYWRFSAVRDRLTREIAVMNAFIVGLKASYLDRKSKNRGMDKAVEEYQKFLKKARKEIIAIAEKQRQKEGEDTTLIQEKINGVKTAESRLAALKRSIKTKADKMKIAVMLLESHNYTAVSDLLVKKPEPVESEKRGKAKESAADVIITQAMAAELVDQGRAELAEMEGKLATAVEKTMKAHEALDNSELFRKRMNKFLKNHAEERFNFMVDIQELVVRTSKALDAGEDGQEAMQRNRKTQIKYARSLQQFFDEFVVVRGQQLTKENESRKFQEMMHRPPYDSKVSIGTPKAQTRTAQLAMNDEDETSGFSTPKMQTSRPNTRQAAVEGDDQGLQPRQLNFHDGDEHPSSLHARSRSESNTEVDQAASSVIRDTNFGIDPARHLSMSKRSSQVNFDDEDEHGVSAASIQRSVDEQLEQLHYNSPENIRKREEELQSAIDQQAKEKRLHDLRSKTFDDYWLSYPRRERSDDLASSSAFNKHNNHKKNDKHVHQEDEVIESADDFFRTNRTRRMWKVIGKAYWRDKEANVRNLLDQGIDITGLNPDDINFIKLAEPADMDPLDLEMNLADDPAEIEAQRQAVEAKRLAMIEPALLVDSFTGLGEELWESPNKANNIFVKTSVSNKEIHEASLPGSVAQSQAQPVVRKPSSGSIGEDSIGSGVKSHHSGASGGESQRHVEVVAVERGVVYDPIVQAGRTSYKTNKATFISRALHAKERIDRTFNADYRLGSDGNLLSSRSFDNSTSPNTRGIVPSAGLLHMASDVDLREGMEDDDDDYVDGKQGDGDELSTNVGDEISKSSSIDHQRQVAEYMRNLENVSPPPPMVDTSPTLSVLSAPIISAPVIVAAVKEEPKVEQVHEEVSIPQLSSQDEEEIKEAAQLDDNQSQEAAASTTTTTTSLKLSETGIEDLLRGKIRRQRKLRQSFQASTGNDVLTATKRLMNRPTTPNKIQEAISKAKQTLLGNKPDSREGHPAVAVAAGAGSLKKQMSSRLRMSVAAVMDSNSAAAANNSKPLDGIAEAASAIRPTKSASVHMGMFSAAAMESSGPKDMSDIVAQALQKIRALNEDEESAAAAAAWNALQEVEVKYRKSSTLTFDPMQSMETDSPVAGEEEVQEEETSVTSEGLTGSFAYCADAPHIAAKIAANRKLSMKMSEAAVLAESVAVAISRASTGNGSRKKGSLKVVINGDEQPSRQNSPSGKQLRFSLELQSPIHLSETSSMHREPISPIVKPGNGQLSSRVGSSSSSSSSAAATGLAAKASDGETTSKPSSAHKIDPRAITPLRKSSAVRRALGMSVVSTPGSFTISEGGGELQSPDSLFQALSQDGAFTDGDSTDMITAKTDNERNLASAEEDLPLVAQLGFLPDGTLGTDGGEKDWDYYPPPSSLVDLPQILKQPIHSPVDNDVIANGIVSREGGSNSRPVTTDIKDLITALQSDNTNGLGVPPPTYPNAVKFNYYPSNFRQNNPDFDEEPSHWEESYKQEHRRKHRIKPYASIQQQQGDEAFPSDHKDSVLLPSSMKLGSLAISNGGSGGNSGMGSKAPTPTHHTNLQVSSVRASMSTRNNSVSTMPRRGGHGPRYGSIAAASLGASIGDVPMMSSRVTLHASSKDDNDHVSVAVYAPREYTAEDDLDYCAVSFGAHSSVDPSHRQSIVEAGLTYDTEGMTNEERLAMEAAIALVQGHQQKLQLKIHPYSSFANGNIATKSNDRVTPTNHDQADGNKLPTPMFDSTHQQARKEEPHVSPYHIRKREAIAKQLADLLADTIVEDDTVQQFVDQAARLIHLREEGLHDRLSAMSPPVGGRLFTKELHFQHIQESEDMMENFYDQLALIPPPGSPDTQRYFVHPRPQSSRRANTSDHTNTANTGRDAAVGNGHAEEDKKEPQVLIQRAGTPEFWIDVTANRNSFRHASPLLSPIASEGGRGVTPELMPTKPSNDENEEVKNTKTADKLITLPGRTKLEDLQTDPHELVIQPIAHSATQSLPPIGDTERKHLEHTRQRQIEQERHALRIEAARQQRIESGLLDPLQRATLQLQSNLAAGGEKNPAPFLKISHSMSSLPPHQSSSSKSTLSYSRSGKIGKKKRPLLLQPLALSKGDGVFSSSVNHLPANWKIEQHNSTTNKGALEVLAVPPSSRQIIRDIAGSDYASTGRASLEISLTTGRSIFQQGPRSRGGIGIGKDGGANSISSSFASLTAPTAIKSALEAVTNSEAFAVTTAEPSHMQQQVQDVPLYNDEEVFQSPPDTAQSGVGQGQQVLPPVVISRRRPPAQQQRSMLRDSLQTSFDPSFVVRNSFGTALLTAEDLMSEEEKTNLQQQRVLLDAIAAANEAYNSRHQTPDGRQEVELKKEDYEADLEAEMRMLFNKPPTPKAVKHQTVTAVDLSFDDRSATRFDTAITEKSLSNTGGSMISSTAAVISASPSHKPQPVREKPQLMKRNPTVKILAPMPYEGDNLLAKAQQHRYGATDLDNLSETSSIRSNSRLQHKALAGKKRTETHRIKL